MTFRDLGTEPLDVGGFGRLLDPTFPEGPATRALLSRLRPASTSGHPVVHGSRVLGLVGATAG